MKNFRDGLTGIVGSSLNRRSFLQVGSLSLLGMDLAQFLQLQAATTNIVTKAKAQAVILLRLEGGPSQYETFDPNVKLSSFQSISTNVPGIHVSELMPKVARHMDKLAIIRSMYSEENNHPEGTYYMFTGHRPNAAMKFPSIGSILTKEVGSRGQIPPFVLVPRSSGGGNEDAFSSAFLGPQFSPMSVPDPGREDFVVPDLSLPESVSMRVIEDRKAFLQVVDDHYRQKERDAEIASMDAFQEKALKMILTPDVKKAFDLSQESNQTKEAYGWYRFGQSALLARRLVEAGARFVTASGFKNGAWDTHADNDRLHKTELVPQLDQTLTALIEDLRQRGLLDSTIVVAMGEFGRTPKINEAKGRDHWNHCWSLALGGGGVQGGQVVGSSDDKGYPGGRRVTIGELFATIYAAFGVDWSKSYMSPVGRPVYIANSVGDKVGEPVRELLGMRT